MQLNSSEIKNIFSIGSASLGDIKIQKDGALLSLNSDITENGKESEYLGRWVLTVNAMSMLIFDQHILPLAVVKDDSSTSTFSLHYDDDAVIFFRSVEPAILMAFVLEAGLNTFGLSNTNSSQSVVSHDKVMSPFRAYVSNYEDGDVIPTIPFSHQLTLDLASSSLTHPTYQSQTVVPKL